MQNLLLLTGVLLLTVRANAQLAPGKIFYDTRVIHGQSVETQREGTMKFIISHRFGPLNSGGYEAFGLDNSTIRLGLDYGFTDRFTVGLGRSSFGKTVDGFAKAKLLTETATRPAIAAYTSLAIDGLRFRDPERDNKFSQRLYYAHQVLLAKRINDRLSLQLMPTLVHRNLVATEAESNDIFAGGFAGRLLLTKRIAMTWEYYHVFGDGLADAFTNSLAVGFDIETKGHVFQLNFGNSRGMIERFFVTETRGSWLDGDISFGFNITRDFKVRGRRS